MVEWTKLLVDSTVRNTSFGTSDSPEDPEVKKVTVLATKSMEHSSLLERIAYFSDWYRTKRAIAICQLFIERMKLHAKKRSDPPLRNDMALPLEGI